jgi:dipeptidyl aminopeptidase/acylaminoacyl peptidase
MRKKIIGILLAVIVLLAAAYLVLGYMLYDRLTTVVEGQSINQPNTPADFKVRGGPYVAFDTGPYEMPAYNLVHFPSRQASVTLAGWYIEGSPTAPVVIVSHGFPHCKCDSNVLTPAGMLHRNGFNILMIDLRNHGQSDVVNGHAAFGNTEWQDVLGAWDWLVSQKKFAPQHIGLYGVSMGGATTLIAFAQEPRVAAAFTDSAFVDLSELIDDELQRMRLPTFLSYGGYFMARIVGGEDLRAHSPREGIVKDAGRPLYLVHGTADQRVDFHQNRELAALAQQSGANAIFWVVDGAGHVESVFHSPTEYEQRVSSFFGAALGR